MFIQNDNNNSTDASVLHRDIVSRSKYADKGCGILPIFTCLSR